MVGDVFTTETLGVFVAEILVEVFSGIYEFLALAVQYREIVDENDAGKAGHFALVDVFIHDVAHEKEFRLGVVYDVVYVVGLEFVQYGYDHRSVGEGGEEGDGPMGGVAAADGNLVAFLYTGSFHQDVHFFYLAGNVFIIVRHTLEVAKCRQFPVFTNGVLDICVETFVHFVRLSECFLDKLQLLDVVYVFLILHIESSVDIMSIILEIITGNIGDNILAR